MFKKEQIIDNEQELTIRGLLVRINVKRNFITDKCKDLPEQTKRKKKDLSLYWTEEKENEINYLSVSNKCEIYQSKF